MGGSTLCSKSQSGSARHFGHTARTPKKWYYFGNRIEVARAYLECLVSVPQLRAKGVREIHHKQPVHYYDQLLGRYAGSQDAIMDDNPLVKRQKVTVGAKSRGPRRPAFPCGIGDADGEQEEGEPSESSEDPELGENVAGKGGAKGIVKEDTIRWVPFLFRTNVRTHKTKGFQYQLEAECLYHRDSRDASGTKCRKHMKFDTEAEREVALAKLKHWCVLGRYVSEPCAETWWSSVDSRHQVGGAASEDLG